MNTTIHAPHLTTESFETEVLRSERPAAVDFYADWCAPCRAAVASPESSSSIRCVTTLRCTSPSCETQPRRATCSSARATSSSAGGRSSARAR
ncbi:MAG: hypothetical protein IPN03_14175 [Holophagales bacterium]|nr:hypothetical protein [Holophagales bacterium]